MFGIFFTTEGTEDHRVSNAWKIYPQMDTDNRRFFQWLEPPLRHISYYDISLSDIFGIFPMVGNISSKHWT